MSVNLKEIINELNNKLKLTLKIEKKIEKKNTARSLQKYILADENNEKYLLEIAENKIEKFYLKRAIKFQEKFSNLKHNFKLNKPLYFNIHNKLAFVIYKYFEKFTFSINNKPIKELKYLYKNNSKKIQLNNENIEKILSNFLSAWPNQYHCMIKRQKEFQKYKKELEKYEAIEVCFEHGDFAINNIVNISNELYLMDFEFARDYQPIGFDIYDYYKSLNKDVKTKYKDLHKIKYLLIEKINKKIDNNNSDVEIYNNLEDDYLKFKWDELYQLGANYNLSYIWCKTWLKYFKRKNFKIFIFTIWENDKLVFLAPLYMIKKTLYLIGSNPDLFDSFNFLYTDEKYIKQFFDYIFTHNYNIDFRYLNSDSIVAKILVKYLYQKNILYESKIIDTKPKVILKDFQIKSKEKIDIKRLNRRIVKKFDEESEFDFNIKKTSKVLNEFISMHIKKWNGGPFKKLKHFDLFIKEISKTDLVIISKLAIKDKAIAYHFAYKDSKNILSSAIPAYDPEYKDVSPGKILLFEILNFCKNSNFKYFDFGRGAEQYKYWFANDSDILFNIRTYNPNTKFVKFKMFINKIIHKLNGILDG